MSDAARVMELLLEALDSNRSPAEVCADSPELLGQVQQRWEHCRRIDAEVGDLFPESSVSGEKAIRASTDSSKLPTVPGYELETILGRGGMGVVYRARHLRLDRPVALKMMLSGAYASSAERQRFLREARAVASLSHVHVVQVHDVGECDGRPYFTMELIEGGSLADRLGGVPEPSGDAATMIQTLAEAVEAAHRCGIIHRDLKPANVLLTVAGAIKISDFGLAMRIEQEGQDALTLSGTRVGTPSYMAPEQASSRHGQVGPAADVYALGAILYEMLTGRPPFRGESAAETERQLLVEEPVPPSRLNTKVPRDLETICLKCLRKAPGRRYESAAALAQDIGRFQRGELLRARPAGLFERMLKWSRRHPSAVVTLTGIMLLMAAGIGAGVWFASERAATATLVENDLRDVARLERQFAWAEARTSLERARARLGSGGPIHLRNRIAQGDRELKLVARIDAIRLERASQTALVVNFITGFEEYTAAFREAGLGAMNDDPVVVAERIRSLDIQPVLVSALDDWVNCTAFPEHQKWLMDVAQRADGSPTDWRASARDPKLWKDKAALTKLVSSMENDPAFTQSNARASSASVTLLLSLGNRLQGVGANDVTVRFLRRVHRIYPNDFWVNHSLDVALPVEKSYLEAARYAQAAIAIRPDAAVAYCRLGEALSDALQIDEAMLQFQHAARLNSNWFRPHFDMGQTFGRVRKFHDAIAAFEEALRVAPDAATLKRLPGVKGDVALIHAAYGAVLRQVGRLDEAEAHYRQALALDPKNKLAAQKLRELNIAQGRPEEARLAWQKSLEAEPPVSHEEWQGYAELCLFLGHEAEYRSTRQALLARFGGTADANIAERTGRTCLMLPGTAEELQQATELIDRALNTNVPERQAYLRPYFLFAKGLAEYRAGRLESAMTCMQSASKVLGPASGLVGAMIQHRLGHTLQARANLASAVLAYDWSPGRVDGTEAYIYHLLRREAEKLILPELPAFLEGKHQPRDNFERIALTAACAFHELHAMRASLWVDVFAADPLMRERARVHAIRPAILAGIAPENARTNPSSVDCVHWRKQAREWLWAELAAGPQTLTRTGEREYLLQTLTTWLAAPEFAAVRDPAQLARLPEEERADWTRLWKELAEFLKKGKAGK